MATKNSKQEKPIRGNWEITLRNLRALKKKVEELDARVKALEEQHPRDGWPTYEV